MFLKQVSCTFLMAWSLAALLGPKAQAQSPAVSFSPTSLVFGNQPVGTTSGALTLTVTNTGTATLTVSKIFIDGTNSQDFAPQSNTCYPSVAAGASCTIVDSFHPSQTGARTAYISIADNVSGSPQLVNLTGTGITATVSLSPGTLGFGSQNVGTTSTTQTLTLTNASATTVTINSIAITG